MPTPSTGYAIASVAALTAIVAADRTEGYARLLLDDGSGEPTWVVYDDSATSGDYQPDDTPATGYWVKVSEPPITEGTTSQYYRGDKTFQTLNAAAISDSTATGQALITAADAAAARAAIGAANLSGSELQRIEDTTTTAVSFTNVWADTGLAIAITPESTASKIEISALLSATLVSAGLDFRILRGATEIYTTDAGATPYVFNNNAGSVVIPTALRPYRDAPSTTAATTYKIQAKANVASPSVASLSFGSIESWMLAREISA